MAAYRRNSTGPRTIAGKLRSSYNALRHGLAASDPRRLVPPGAASDWQGQFAMAMRTRRCLQRRWQ